MPRKRIFDMDAYVLDICKAASIDPKGLKALQHCDGESYYFLEFRSFLKYVAIQNWSKNRWNLVDFNSPDFTELDKELESENWKLNLPSVHDMTNYAKLILIYGNLCYPIIDMLRANRLYLRIAESLKEKPHWFIFGEPGCDKIELACNIAMRYVWESKLPDNPINSLPEKDGSPSKMFDIIETSRYAIFECTGTNDEMLHADLFGHAKNSYNGAYYESKGLIGILTEKTDEILQKRIHDGESRDQINARTAIVLSEFQRAGIGFQKAILAYLDNGSYFRLGENQLRKGNCAVICTITGTRDELSTSKSIGQRPDLYCNSPFIPYFCDPLFFSTSEIPIAIFRACQHFKETAVHDDDMGDTDLSIFEFKIPFPYILINYWYAHERWPENYEQLERELKEYIEGFIGLAKLGDLKYIRNPDDYRESLKKYINPVGKLSASEAAMSEAVREAIEVNKETFLRLIKIPSNPGFQEFVANRELEPFDILEIDDLLYKPVSYYTYRYFDKVENRWIRVPEGINRCLHLDSLSVDSDSQNCIIAEMHACINKKSSVYDELNKHSLILSSEKTIFPQKSGIPDSYVSPEANRPKHNLSDLEIIRARLDDEKTADKTIILQFKNGDVDTVEFGRINTISFSLLLFLIYERQMKEEGWLLAVHRIFRRQFDNDAKSVKNIQAPPMLLKVLAFCQMGQRDGSITDTGWWGEKGKRKNAIDSIRKAFNKKIEGNIIKELPNYGKYRDCTLADGVDAIIDNLPGSIESPK